MAVQVGRASTAPKQYLAGIYLKLHLMRCQRSREGLLEDLLFMLAGTPPIDGCSRGDGRNWDPYLSETAMMAPEGDQEAAAAAATTSFDFAVASRSGTGTREGRAPLKWPFSVHLARAAGAVAAACGKGCAYQLQLRSE